MKCNVSKTGQAFRLLTGMLFVAWAVAGGPIWTWVGLVIAATGAWRLCPVLFALGIRRLETDTSPGRDDMRSRQSPSQSTSQDS